VGARLLPPHGFAGIGIDGDEVAIGTGGIKHAINHFRLQAHACLHRAIAHARLPQPLDLERGCELGELGRRFDVFFLGVMATGQDGDGRQSSH